MEKIKVSHLINRHTEHKLSGINLIASENRIHKNAVYSLASDLSGRYEKNYYAGDKYAEKITDLTEKLAKKLFGVKYAFITPISGNICDLAVLFAFSKPGDTITGIPWSQGGYPLGYEKFERSFWPLPMKDYIVDIANLKEFPVNSPLLLLASSIIPFPHPVKKLSDLFEGVFVYDASHVLGLIAGKKFQRPLNEGCDILIGSTHKSFPGPQGGIVLTNNEEIADKLNDFLKFSLEKGIGLIDNPHVHRIACLGLVIEEMIEYAQEYASQIVVNAKTLAEKLYNLNIPVKFKEKGFTESHQIILDITNEKAKKLQKILEKNKIFIDSIGRLGVAELTYIGMKKPEMKEIGEMIARVYEGKRIGNEATDLSSRFYR